MIGYQTRGCGSKLTNEVTSIFAIRVQTGPDFALAARISFTLFDASDIVNINCRLDGGAFVTCGSGTNGQILFTNLTQDQHLVEIYGADVHGNMGLTEVSQPPPAPFARMTFDLCGDAICDVDFGETPCNCEDCFNDPSACEPCECGTRSGACACDNACADAGDCCSNVCSVCGFCGGGE